MDNHLAGLLELGGSLTRAEYSLLQHFTAHPPLMGKITVREPAQTTFICSATIRQLCHKPWFQWLQRV